MGGVLVGEERNKKDLLARIEPIPRRQIDALVALCPPGRPSSFYRRSSTRPAARGGRAPPCPPLYYRRSPGGGRADGASTSRVAAVAVPTSHVVVVRPPTIHVVVRPLAIHATLAPPPRRPAGVTASATIASGRLLLAPEAAHHYANICWTVLNGAIVALRAVAMPACRGASPAKVPRHVIGAPARRAS